MNRREFIHHSILSSTAVGLATALPRPAFSQACPVVDVPRTLVNVMLQGGADMRFLFMPAPSHWDSQVLAGIWEARRSLYSPDYPDYGQMFDNEYLAATDPMTGLEFGIHNSAAWLHSEFQAGRVAVVANAYCSRNRRHDQSILNADAGVPGLGQLNFDRDGWGGRLAEQISAAGNEGAPVNVVELGQAITVFSKGSEAANRTSQVVHAEDMRNMALAGESPDQPWASRRNVLARALSGWYETRGDELRNTKAPDWRYQPFLGHYQALNEFGLAVEDRLALCMDLPEALQSLQLSNNGFAQQCRNLFDVCQMPDILTYRLLSMSYGGWDTHDNESFEISGNLADLFGTEGGFATTMPLLDQLPYLETPASHNLSFYFASDFGRQLKANGTGGTDHGRGTYSILTGGQVNGGVYGEMFPQAEVLPDEDGRVPLETQGADIQGLTSTEKILAQACEWTSEGSSESVFPDASTADIETPGMLDSLFTA